MKTLLPQPFKFVGYAVPILFLIGIFAAKALVPDFDLTWTEHFKGRPEILFSMISIGFLVVALSRDKFEDERTERLRLEAVTYAFLFGVMQILFHSLGIWTSEEAANSASLMAMVLAGYLFMFEIRKRVA